MLALKDEVLVQRKRLFVHQLCVCVGAKVTTCSCHACNHHPLEYSQRPAEVPSKHTHYTSRQHIIYYIIDRLDLIALQGQIKLFDLN